MSDEFPIDVSFSYVPDDFSFVVVTKESNKGEQAARAERKGVFTRSFLGWVVVLSFFVLLFVVFHKAAGHAGADEGAEIRQAAGVPGWAVGVMIALGVLSVISIGLLVQIVPGMRKKFLNADVSGSRRVEISEEGVRWEEEKYRAEFRWGYFSQFSETKQAFHLFAGSVVYVVPKRVLTGGQVEVVRRVFGEQVRG